MSDSIWDKLTWDDAVAVAQFLEVKVIDLAHVPFSRIEQALLIVRARNDE